MMDDDTQPMSFQPGAITPAQALYVRRSLELGARARPDLFLKRSRWLAVPEERFLILTHQLSQTLANAECLIWDDQIIETALAGQKSFEGSSLQKGLGPLRPQLWFLRGQLYGDEESHRFFEVPTSAQCDSILISRVAGAHTDRLMDSLRDGTHDSGVLPAEVLTGRKGLGIALLFNPLFDAPPVEPAYEESLPYIRFLPPLYEGMKISTAYCGMIAALSFLGLPFVETRTAEKVSRQQRRACERAGHVVPEVREVLLRRKGADEPESAPSGSTPGSRRNYDHQWLVGAHWRRRAENWNKGEGPIFVSPYLKGPKDKEFRPPRETVYVAKR